MEVVDQSSPPKVLVVSQVPPPHHGSTIMTQVFLESLETLGMEAHLVDRRFSKTVGDVGKFSATKVFKSFGLLGRFIYELILRRPARCIIFITNRPGSFVIDWVLTELLRLFRYPIINYVHTNGFYSLANRNRVFEFLVGRALGAADTTVCLGPSLTSDVSDLVKGDIAIIANTPYRLPEVTHHRSPQVSFLFLSNLIPEKGVTDFVRAAVELCEADEHVSFVVAGAVPDADIYRQISDHINNSSHSRRIRLLGKADEETKWKLLQTSHALVFPSIYPYEAQPLTIVEAMAMGLPVIAYDIGGIRDLVKHGVTGVLVDAGDYKALFGAMRQSLEDPDTLELYGAEARNYFDSEFSRRAYESRWDRVLNARRIGPHL